MGAHILTLPNPRILLAASIFSVSHAFSCLDLRSRRFPDLSISHPEPVARAIYYHCIAAPALFIPRQFIPRQQKALARLHRMHHDKPGEGERNFRLPAISLPKRRGRLSQMSCCRRSGRTMCIPNDAVSYQCVNAVSIDKEQGAVSLMFSCTNNR